MLPSRILIRLLNENQLPRSHDIDFDKGWQSDPLDDASLTQLHADGDYNNVMRVAQLLEPVERSSKRFCHVGCHDQPANGHLWVFLCTDEPAAMKLQWLVSSICAHWFFR